ncbi:hypothetical protein ES705_43307 [subsurface metagenome]
MQVESGYLYSAIIPEKYGKPGLYNYCIAVKENNKITTHPSGILKSPGDWDFHDNEFWEFTIVEPKSPLRLLIPEKDIDDFAFTRIGDGIRWGIYDIVTNDANGEPALKIYYPVSYDKNIDDYTLSLIVKNKIENRNDKIQLANSIRIEAKSESEGQEIYITLVEADGTSWSKKVALSSQWKTYSIPLEDFTLAKGVKLPLGFPERWNYWIEPALGRGGENDRLQPSKIERLQVSLRSGTEGDIDADPWIEISSICLLFK